MDNITNWFISKNSKITEITDIKDFPDKTFGFIYLLTIIVKNKTYYYIGKKNLYSTINKKLNKKEIEDLKQTKKSKKKISTKKKIINESNWKVYCSSNSKIKELVDNKKYNKIYRKILYFAFSNKELNYLEAKSILCNDALIKNDFLNAGFNFTCMSKLKF